MNELNRFDEYIGGLGLVLCLETTLSNPCHPPINQRNKSVQYDAILFKTD